MSALTLGPVLGYESGDDGAFYTCLVATNADAPVWIVDGARVAFRNVADLASGGAAWRAEWPVPAARPAARHIEYRIEAAGEACTSAVGASAWRFYCPAENEQLRFVYGSCNGFSALKLMASTAQPHRMWERMADDHESKPLSLLVLGGDQIYADSVWEQPWLHAFAELTDEKMATAPVTSEMDGNLDAFYERLYFRQWNAPAVALILASVPSIMMWDDHDIFDGWGSHPASLQSSPVYQRIYRSAERAFTLFQLRGNTARGRLGAGGAHFAYVATLNSETFLMLDHRTERTPTVVMGEEQWTALKSWLGSFSGRRLFIQSAVPVVYRTFGLVERALAATEKREELEDDLNDHWSAREHQQERLRFIYTFVERMRELRGNADPRSYHPRWVFLSGDVHVACMGSVWERDLDIGLYQVVSSALVHPPPSFLQWLGICAFSGDGNQKLGNGDLETEIHEIAGAGSKFLRTRNYARLELEKEKVWINWRCESEVDTVFCA